MTEQTETELMDLGSMDLTDEKKAELLALFPEARTEGGKIDFDQLKRALGEIVEPGKERYGMTWPGKADCFKTIQTPSMGTLRPMREQSVNFDDTKNVIIEGDNLEVLKLMQKAYLGKVKMIYIDPPYNTGNDFIYPDDFAENLQTYLEYTGQVDDEGKKFSTNTDASGRFHTRWLNMMYPRLYLARNLLRDDGVIFVSIDDNEYTNLRRVLDDVFGEENFVATVIWQKVYAPKNSAKHFSEDHDYVVVYSRNAEHWRPHLLPRSDDAKARYSNPDNDPRGPWKSENLTARNAYKDGRYEVTGPTGKIFTPPRGAYWRYSKANFEVLVSENRIWWGPDNNASPAKKSFLSEVKEGIVPQTLWTYKDVGHTQEAKKELLKYVDFEDTENVLNSVKPPRLIKRMLQIATKPDGEDIVLDFFAGSGPTAQAVLMQNEEDGGNRRFVLVQLPEPLPKPEERIKTISDMARARISNWSREAQERLAQTKLDDTEREIDVGYRLERLSSSNFERWDGDVHGDAKALQSRLEGHVSHVKKDRSAEDVFFEVLLKSGFPLDTEVKQRKIGGVNVFDVGEGSLFICLDRKVTLEAIRAIAEEKPVRAVFLDEAFTGDDQLKVNAIQTFKAVKPDEKGDVTVFQTV